jgi:large conductance mechanosensitive channel
MFKEFKEFAVKGNVIDLAVGIIIGAAFGKIISSLVNDIIMPPIGRLLGSLDFGGLFVNLTDPSRNTPALLQEGDALLKYGAFINNVIDFLIIAFVIFMLIRWINRMKKKPVPVVADPTTKTCPHCFTEIPIKAVRCPNCTSELK